jgi:predicted amidophosphoribosyltransferase
MSLELGLPLFIGTLVVLVLVMSGAALLRLRPTKVCPFCGEPVLLERRRCKQCGYEYERFRGMHH